MFTYIIALINKHYFYNPAQNNITAKLLQMGTRKLSIKYIHVSEMKFLVQLSKYAIFILTHYTVVNIVYLSLHIYVPLFST